MTIRSFLLRKMIILLMPPAPKHVLSLDAIEKGRIAKQSLDLAKKRLSQEKEMSDALDELIADEKHLRMVRKFKNGMDVFKEDYEAEDIEQPEQPTAPTVKEQIDLELVGLVKDFAKNMKEKKGAPKEEFTFKKSEMKKYFDENKERIKQIAAMELNKQKKTIMELEPRLNQTQLIEVMAMIKTYA